MPVPSASHKTNRTPAPILDFAITLDETLPLVRRARYKTSVRRGRMGHMWGDLVDLEAFRIRKQLETA